MCVINIEGRQGAHERRRAASRREVVNVLADCFTIYSTGCINRDRPMSCTINIITTNTIIIIIISSSSSKAISNQQHRYDTKTTAETSVAIRQAIRQNH